MAIIAKSTDVTKHLLVHREPCDLSALVKKANDNLQRLVEKVNLISEQKCWDIVIDKIVVDEVIDALQKLECERLWLKEILEAETITSSVLRHRLLAYPRDSRSEIQAAVRSARESNIVFMEEYKIKLVEIEENIELMKNKLKVTLVNNVTLDPEKREMLEKHEGIVSILNQTLLEKASMQIKLNETRDFLRETMGKTRDFEEALCQLSEDMDVSRQEAKIEESRINAQIESTMEKIQSQRELNKVKQMEVEFHQLELKAQQKEALRIREILKNHEQHCDNLQQLISQLSEQLEIENKENEILIGIGHEFKEQHVILTDRYRDEKLRLEQDISSLESEIHITRAEFDRLQMQKQRAKSLMDASMLATQQNKDKLDGMQKGLRRAKDDLLQQTSENARIRKEMINIQMVIDQTHEDHIGTTDGLTKKCENFKQDLAAERKERQQLQAQREQLSIDASDYFNEYNKLIESTTKKINEGKVRHQLLTTRGKELQGLLKTAEISIKSKQEELFKAKDEYINLQKRLRGKVVKLETNIKDLEEELSELNLRHEEKVSRMNELHERYRRKADEFDEMKKYVVRVKTNKSNLEATLLSKQEKLEKMTTPMAKLRSELGSARTQYLQQMEGESELTHAIEKELYKTNYRLNAVSLQNKRLRKSIEYFESDIAFMKTQVVEMRDGKRSNDITVGEYRDWLEMQWTKHMALDKKYYDEDILLLDDIKRVEEVTSIRDKKIECIHGKLEAQLDILTEFIDHVADIRIK